MIARSARAELEEGLGDRVRFDAPLARFTSLRVGGPADALATPESRADLARLLAICARHRLPHIVLGAGFNTLALDGGVEERGERARLAQRALLGALRRQRRRRSAPHEHHFPPELAIARAQLLARGVGAQRLLHLESVGDHARNGHARGAGTDSTRGAQRAGGSGSPAPAHQVRIRRDRTS